MERQVKELDFSGKTIHVGIDTPLKSWKVAIGLEHSIQKVFSQEPDPEILSNHLRKHYPNGEYYCVYEAGGGDLSVIRHYTLRFIFWYKGYAPGHYARFLDYCAEELHFLQK